MEDWRCVLRVLRGKRERLMVVLVRVLVRRVEWYEGGGGLDGMVLGGGKWVLEEEEGVW